MLLLVCGDNTGCGDNLVGISGSDVIEELLCSFAQLGIGLSYQHEGTLDNIAAILNGFFGGSTPSTVTAFTVSLTEATEA
jgi:hypothetical protein